MKISYHADLRGNEVTESVEPIDVSLQVVGFTFAEEALT